MLRLVSFGMDVHWAAARAGPASASLPAPAPLRPSLPLFLAYVLYPPLLIAGPIMTFADFAAAMGRPLPPRFCRAAAAAPAPSPPNTPPAAAAAPPPPPHVLALRDAARYAARVVVVWLCLEALTHAIHASAAASALRASPSAFPVSPSELGAIAYWTLLFMWLKFTLVWRFARAWALAAGVNPPENMLRCVNNNYTVEGFWRGWHASFNLWLVKYIYVPLGGRNNKLLASWPCFLFVALWHDLAEPRLLFWAAACAGGLAPEAAARALGASRSLFSPKTRSGAAFRHACAAAAALNISLLMAANLGGFVVGPDSLFRLVLGALRTDTTRGPESSGASSSSPSMLASAVGRLAFPAAAFLCFFSAAHVMFETRAAEARRADLIELRRH